MSCNLSFRMNLVLVLAMFSANVALAQTHLLLGGEEEEENDAMILRPRQFEEGPDGNLYVLDGGDSFIKVYSPSGDYLRKLAGPGEGPGEFQRTDGSTFGFTTDGNLFFTEFFGGHRWLTIMDLNGDLIQTLLPQISVNYGIERAVSLEDGDFLVQITYGSTAYPSRSYYLYKSRKSLIHLDKHGAMVTEIVETEHPTMISTSPNGGTTNLPFSPVFVWVARPNKTIIWSEGLDPRLAIFDFAGQNVGQFDTQLPPPEKVTKGELEEWRRARKEYLEPDNPEWWHRFGRVIEDYDQSLFDKPVLGRISAAPAGHLLIEDHWSSDTEQTTFRLFDKEGKMVSSLTATIGSLHISPRYLLFISANEDGSRAVNALEWSGEVGESLNFLEAWLMADQ